MNTTRPTRRQATRRGLSHGPRAAALTALGAALMLGAPSALGSGSIGAGAGISQYGAIYKQGKMVFFGKLACSRAECPIKRDQVDAALAEAVVRSIRSAAGIRLEESGHDAAVAALGADEQEKYYLSRRLGIDS